jgi:hypothetical protein
MTDGRDVLTKAYAAFNARDMDAVLAAMLTDWIGPTAGKAAASAGTKRFVTTGRGSGRQSIRRSNQLDSRPIRRGARW